MTAGSSDFSLDPRLLRHFAVLRLRPQSSADLRNIIFSVLEANLTDKPLNQELHECIAAASSKLIEMVKDVLRPWWVSGVVQLFFHRVTTFRTGLLLELTKSRNESSYCSS